MKNAVIYIGRKNGSQYLIRQFRLAQNKKCESNQKGSRYLLYSGTRGQGVLNIYPFGFVLIPIPVHCVAVRWGQ
jgi:hypothetical protein